jgi:hypothetical protein
LTSTLYSINAATFAIAGVTKTAGKCYWKAAQDTIWTNQVACYSITSRGGCISDSRCSYEYFSDTTNSIYYFKEENMEPNNALTADFESFSASPGTYNYASCVVLCLR